MSKEKARVHVPLTKAVKEALEKWIHEAKNYYHKTPEQWAWILGINLESLSEFERYVQEYDLKFVIDLISFQKRASMQIDYLNAQRRKQYNYEEMKVIEESLQRNLHHYLRHDKEKKIKQCARLYVKTLDKVDLMQVPDVCMKAY